MKSFTEDQINLISKVAEGKMDYDRLPGDLQDKLYEFYFPQMPYGTAKARTGDPVEFICDRLEQDFC